MQPLVVVSNFKEGRQIGAHCVEVAPAIADHLLLVESLHERFGLGVVVRITHVAHGGWPASYYHTPGRMAHTSAFCADVWVRKSVQRRFLQWRRPASRATRREHGTVLPTYNESMTITLKDFQVFVEERMGKAIGDPDLLQAKLKEVMDFGFANEASMDSEANAYFDNLLKKVADTFEVGLRNVPDSPNKRKMLRAIAGTRREHHSSQALLKRLGMPYPVARPIVEAARPVFLQAHQSILDLLWDATRQSQAGIAQFATMGLLYWTVDELTAAFYLAERRYTTQAYSHLRTVHDLLHKAQLFFQHPQWAEVWASGDQKKIASELSPGEIRKKLGNSKFDPIYGFFTQLGTHGTFEALRKRVTQEGKREGLVRWRCESEGLRGRVRWTP